MNFRHSLMIGTSSEYRNEPRIHNTVDQCYEFWVHSDIPSSFRLPGNDENLSNTSPNIGKCEDTYFVR